ncbi:uncharacterized protein LOC125538287 [Triticum urartu]|uniref:uncharacterized protein LOC125538287 n=1 Tax=Triticum urartu TaxID=4572 RepID=UPI002043A8BA|nr:uncharacterized protein LOC125538287 [Triticum urartu]
MAPSKGERRGGDPAEGEDEYSASVGRCARSGGICPTRRHADDEARRRCRRAGATSSAAVTTTRFPVDALYGSTTARARPWPALRRPCGRCGSYTDTPPRCPTPVSASTALGIKGGRGGRGLKNKRDEMPVEVSRDGVHSDGFEESVARCGFRNPSLVRRCATPPRRDSTRCAQMGACIPVAVGRGRGHKDTHDDYYGTSRPRAAELHAPTADLRAEMYDTGSIEGPPGSFTVNNVQVFAGYVLHTGSFLEGPDSETLSVGDEVKYKEVIGDRIDQKGHIALPEKLIFDFSHGKPVQPEDLQKIESIVKQRIEAELELSAQEIKLANPKSVNGLRAVFGEIYPDPVRVVSIGRKLEDVLANPESKEWLSDINEASKLDGATLEKKIGWQMAETSQMAETTKDEMSLTTHAAKNKALETM